jgi:integrase
MSRFERLTALKVTRIREPGMYADGGGLYLQVTINSREGEPAKSWIYRYMLRGRAREMGLGPLHTVSLSLARDHALKQRQLRLRGIDPIDARRAERAHSALDSAKAITFQECAEKYMAAHKAAWSNAKHAGQWQATLATYAEPIIGELPVQTVDTALVTKVLEQEVGAEGQPLPLWTARPETASRLRGRIEAILDWAKVRGFREGENPARWRGHLDKLLPARSKVQKVEHHAAIPYSELPELLAVIKAQEGTAVRALEFAILNAARTGEVIGAQWNEINMADRLWTVPAARMKVGREHRVPLSPRAIAILEEMRALKGQERPAGFVFSGRKIDQPLSSMALLTSSRSAITATR